MLNCATLAEAPTSPSPVWELHFPNANAHEGFSIILRRIFVSLQITHYQIHNMKHKLRIGVISRIASATITNELSREAKVRGHHYDQIIFDTADLGQSDEAFTEANLLSYDILYYRSSLGLVWARALQHYLARHNRRAINLTAVEFPFLNDKAFQALAMETSEIPTPKTTVDTRGSFLEIATQIGAPFVAKACNSSQGKDVHLIHTEQEYKVFVATRTKKAYIFQEYVPHDYDCRIHLVNGQAVGGFRRVQTSSDFRCNVSLGATMEPLEVSEEAILSTLSNKVAKLFNLELHVVDFLKSKKDGKYYFVEINNNPGWETSDTEATGIDMSSLVMDSFETLASAVRGQVTSAPFLKTA